MYFDEEKLLVPCPFCGSVSGDLEIIRSGLQRYYVFCHCCETEGPKAANLKMTIESWNECRNENKKASEIALTISEATA